MQKQLAGGLIIDKAPDLNPQGGMVLERGGIKLLSGVMVPEAKLAGVMIPERTLAGGLLIERHLAGGLIVDRYGRNV